MKIRDEGLVRNKAVHIALGVRADGTKEVLGLWLEQNEGAKFWLRVMNGLRNRGVDDVLLAVVDGLKGSPEAIRAVFPEATVHTSVLCICCAIAWTSCRGRTASQRRRRCRISTGPSTLLQPRQPCRRSRPGRGARNTRPSAKAGGGPGAR